MASRKLVRIIRPRMIVPHSATMPTRAIPHRMLRVVPVVRVVEPHRPDRVMLVPVREREGSAPPSDIQDDSPSPSPSPEASPVAPPPASPQPEEAPPADEGSENGNYDGDAPDEGQVGQFFEFVRSLRPRH